MRLVGLLLGLVLAAGEASADSTPAAEKVALYSAAARPAVRVTIGRRSLFMLVDTGARGAFLGVKAARAARLPVGKMRPVGLDYANRPIEGTPLDVEATLAGIGPLPSLLASEWADSVNGNTDGLFSPQQLARDGRAIVLDFARGELRLVAWPEALALVGACDRELTAGEIYATSDSKFLVPAVVDGNPLRLAIDTGAPSSLLYQERGDDLPDGAVRARARRAHVRVGDLDESIEIESLEPLPSGGGEALDGLLGMDVLRSCVLALDAEKLVGRCRSSVAIPSALIGTRSDTRGLMRFSGDGPWLRKRLGPGYEWSGKSIHAVIHADGTVTLDPGSRVEAEWFMKETLDMRVGLAAKFREKLVAQSLDGLPGHLAGVWNDPALAPVERRAILLAIWGEAAEPDDPELGAAGARARQLVGEFVRRNLPAGSELAFADAELDRFNASRGNLPHFDPYRENGLDLLR